MMGPILSTVLLLLVFISCLLTTGSSMSVASSARTSATRTILISGANRGIGLEMVRQWLLLTVNSNSGDDDNDARLSIIATTRNLKQATALHDLVLTTQQTTGSTTSSTTSSNRLTVEALDVTSLPSMEALAQRLTKQNQKIEVLINNAGIYTGGAHPVHDAATMMNVNYYGPKQLTRILAEYNVLAQQALIINVSSGMGSLSGFSQHAQQQLMDQALTEESLDDMVEQYIRQNNGDQGWPLDVYSASKGALNAWTRIRHKQQRPENLSYCCVCPGWVRTEMGGSSAPRSVQQGADTMVWLAKRHVHAHHGSTDVATRPKEWYAGKIFRDRQEIEW